LTLTSTFGAVDGAIWPVDVVVVVCAMAGRASTEATKSAV
jgi:hypothetical protein